MKIAMSSLVKNEINFISNYLTRNKDADYICLLDTGSTDGTWEYLQEQAQSNPKLIIQQIIYENFKFDVARNDSFKLIPEDTDIIVALDIDEYFTDNNWTEIVKNNINVDGTIHFYTTPYLDYSDYSLTDKPRLVATSRIHQTKNFKWYYCVHEVISDADWENLGNRFEENVDWNKLFIVHQPNPSKDRTSYLDLCLQRISEKVPVHCDETMEAYLSKDLLLFEYYRNNMFNEAISLYNNDLINCQEVEHYKWMLFDVAPCMYKMTNNVKYLREAIDTLDKYWYEQHLLYFALKYDFKYCKKYKNVILQKIAEHDLQIEERFRELDVLGNEIKQLSQKL